ncbi:TPA: hypothetical protein ACH3X1_001636 [Trebouxia sp. C0004]
MCRSAASLIFLSSCCSNNRWGKFDDRRQAQVSIEEVVSHVDAYILWYVRNQPRIVVVGCEVWPPGSGPQSEPEVAVEEPKTHSGAPVKEVARWLIAAGNAAPVSGSRSHAQVQEFAPEGGGAQAAQVGVVSPAGPPTLAGLIFDMDGWLTTVGLVPHRRERIAEAVEVPDVLPAVTPVDVPAAPFMECPTATPGPSGRPRGPFGGSQASPSVSNEGSAVEVLGPNLTMTTPMDASETHASAPSEPHIVQAAAPSPFFTHVSPLAEMMAPAVEEGSPLTLEPSRVGPVSEQAPSAKAPPSVMGHPASQELPFAVEVSSPPSPPPALSVTPSVAQTPARTAPAMPIVQPASSQASSFMHPQKVTRQLPNQVTKQLLKQAAVKASGVATAKQAAVSGAQHKVDPQAQARIQAVADRYAQQKAHQQKQQAAAAGERKRQPLAATAQPPPPSLTSAARVVSESLPPRTSSGPVAAASAASPAVRTAKKSKQQDTAKPAQKAVAAATAPKAAHSGSVAAKAAESEPVEKATAASAKQGEPVGKATAAVAKQGGATGVKKAASVSSPAAAAEQKTASGRAAACSNSGSSAKAAGEKPLSSKAGKQRLAMSAQAEISTGSVSHAANTSTAGRAATSAGKSATTSEASTITKSSAHAGPSQKRQLLLLLTNLLPRTRLQLLCRPLAKHRFPHQRRYSLFLGS